MAGPLHEVLAAGELGVGGIYPGTRLVGKIEELPHADRRANIVGERQIVLRRRIAALRQRLHEAPKIIDVLRRHADVGAVGKGRIEMPAIPSDAARHGVAELRERPGADAGRFIGRDIGRIKRAEGALQAAASG